MTNEELKKLIKTVTQIKEMAEEVISQLQKAVDEQSIVKLKGSVFSGGGQDKYECESDTPIEDFHVFDHHIGLDF